MVKERNYVLIILMLLIASCTPNIEPNFVPNNLSLEPTSEHLEPVPKPSSDQVTPEPPIEEKPELEGISQLPSEDTIEGSISIENISLEPVAENEPAFLEIRITSSLPSSETMKVKVTFVELWATSELNVFLPADSTKTVSVPLGAIPCEESTLKVELNPENLIELPIENNGLTYKAKAKCTARIQTRFNYFDYCWQYDCSAAVPYPEMENIILPEAKVTREVSGLGNLKAIIVFLYADEPLPETKLRILTNGSKDVRSFNYAAHWFNEQTTKYGMPTSLKIEYSGEQHKLPEEYIVHTYEESLTKDFTEFILTELPQYKDYDMVVPFYYSSKEMAFANHVSGANSFVIFSKQPNPGFFYPSFEEDTYAQTFTHELMHLLGASDKYTCMNPSSEECTLAKEKGIGCILDEPDIEYDIMCHRKAHYGNMGWGFVTPELPDLTIAETTAKEIGWKDVDGDGVIEIMDACPLDRTNSCGE